MLPYFKPGDLVLISSFIYLFIFPKVGDVIVFKKNNNSPPMIKRITKVSNFKIFVEGDNKGDSLNPGYISKKDIIGKVLFKI